VKLRNVDDIDGLQSFEKKIFNAIFMYAKENEVSLASLNNEFYAYLPGIKDALYQHVVEEKYFGMNPDTVRGVYLGISISFFIILLIVGGVCWAKVTWFYFLFIPLIGVVFIVLSFFMPRKTLKGVRLYENILGFKMFLKATSEDRLKVLFSPKDYKGLFEKYLPYAMVFEVEEEWAKQFEGLYDEIPDWYKPLENENFMTFVSSMKSMGACAEKVYTSVPKPVYSSSSSSSSSSSWKSSGWGSSSSFSSGSSSSSWSGGSGVSSGGSGGGFGGGGGSSW
jgi:uncharacterized membrane protein YgcG